MLAYGLLATLGLTFELLLTRILSERGVKGKYIGLNFLVAEGIIGTACLVISSLSGSGIYSTGASGVLLMLIAGVTGFTAVSTL